MDIGVPKVTANNIAPHKWIKKEPSKTDPTKFIYYYHEKVNNTNNSPDYEEHINNLKGHPDANVSKDADGVEDISVPARNPKTIIPGEKIQHGDTVKFPHPGIPNRLTKGFYLGKSDIPEEAARGIHHISEVKHYAGNEEKGRGAKKFKIHESKFSQYVQGKESPWRTTPESKKRTQDKREMQEKALEEHYGGKEGFEKMFGHIRNTIAKSVGTKFGFDSQQKSMLDAFLAPRFYSEGGSHQIRLSEGKNMSGESIQGKIPSMDKRLSYVLGFEAIRYAQKMKFAYEVHPSQVPKFTILRQVQNKIQDRVDGAPASGNVVSMYRESMINYYNALASKHEDKLKKLEASSMSDESKDAKTKQFQTWIDENKKKASVEAQKPDQQMQKEISDLQGIMDGKKSANYDIAESTGQTNQSSSSVANKLDNPEVQQEFANILKGSLSEKLVDELLDFFGSDKGSDIELSPELEKGLSKLTKQQKDALDDLLSSDDDYSKLMMI